MSELRQNKLTGQIVSIETGYQAGGPYWVDFTLRLIEGHVVNISYFFPRESIRNNIRNSVHKGLMVTVFVDDQVSLEKMISYSGVGAIQVHDLSNELDRYVREKFSKTESDYFSQSEIDTIDRMLIAAKQRIQEEFKPNKEVMDKVDEHIDSLARKTKSVTKYDWRRLFVSCVVSISVDLGFGSTIPEALFNLFKKLVKELFEHKLSAPNVNA
jgi:hypothetical protein